MAPGPDESDRSQRHDGGTHQHGAILTVPRAYTRVIQPARSMRPAAPMPPPMHMVTTA